MAETATLARPYANAAFALAKSSDRLEKWSRMLGLLAAAAGADKVRALLGAATVSGAVKAGQLLEVAGDELDDRGRRFVHVLADNGRLDLLPEVSRQYEERKAEAERVLEVEIAAAVELTGEQRQTFAAALAKRFEQEVEVTTAVDANVVGGAVIRAGDTVIDGSVRGRLTRLIGALQRA